jgi:ABC-type dipeptide/oligopeptide/nickel transport system permease component
LIASIFGLSVPSFWLAPVLILFFSLKLDLLPVSGNQSFASLVLPTISLGIGLASVLFRVARASTLENLGEDYIRTAHAKGLEKNRVYLHHVLRNSLLPIVTTVSVQLGAVLTGVILTETVFDWPGLGVLFFRGLQSRNYPLIQGCVLVIATIYILVNVVTDITYSLVDPRLRNS